MADIKKTELIYDDSAKLNKKGQVILGRLKGPCADVINSTRNGRKYSESLWENVFKNDIVKEYFECGGIPGELDHPLDRLETCSEKIAIMMPEPPTRDDKGRLIASFDILDTPNGRIAKTLADYGYKLGISSRGDGETYVNMEGSEEVNEDTYSFQGFDLVLLPAVKDARLELVESLGNNKTLKKALTEALNKSSESDRKIMEETLTNLNIEYTPEKVIDKTTIVAANDDGAEMVKTLQESLLAQRKLETQITELQEKLSVCYTKEAGYEESIIKYKDAIRNLSEKANNANALKSKINSINEELITKDTLLKEKETQLERLNKKHSLGVDRQSHLSESMASTTHKLKEANSTITKLGESLQKVKATLSSENNVLKEQLEESKKDYKIKSVEYSNKLAHSNKLVEQYRETAKKAVSKYIESQALKLGVNPIEISNKLPKNYTFNDIDRIYEELSQYKLKVGSLPFKVDQDIKKISITESKPLINSHNDDTIDDSLLKLANL